MTLFHSSNKNIFLTFLPSVQLWKNNQQPCPKETGYVVFIRYLYSGVNPFNRHESRTQKRVEGIKPLKTNKYPFFTVDLKTKII
jgi:hypothetical protein